MRIDAQGRRIFYFCYDHDRPSGGQKDTYRHVDVVSASGAEAYVMHPRRDRRLDWFPNDTPFIDRQAFDSLHRPDRDIVVLPEDLAEGIFEFPGRKVIFNKNLYYGFRCLGEPPFTERDPYRDPDVIGVMTVSEHNWMHLRYAYPRATLTLVVCGVPGDVYMRRPLSGKRRMVAYSAKVPGHVLTLYHMLRARAEAGLNDLADVEWKKLSKLTEPEVVEVLDQAMAFVCLSTEEGVARSVLEAMSSGCVICAYENGPFAEHVPPPCQFAMGDLVSAARFLERLFARNCADRQYFVDLSDIGASRAARYGDAQERDSIVAAWNTILGQA